MTSQKMGHHVTDMQPLMWLWCHLIWPFLCKKGENLSNISSWNSHYCVCFLSTKFSFMKVQTCLNLGSEWCHHFLKPWVINQKVLYVKTNLNLCTLSDIKDFSISHHITKKRGVPKLRRTCGHPVEASLLWAKESIYFEDESSSTPRVNLASWQLAH